MRVVHYLTSLSSSGGGLFYAASGLARAQAALGADVTVIGGVDHHFANDCGAWAGVRVRPYRLRGSYGFHPRLLLDLMSVGRPVFHVHGIWSASSLYARQMAGLGSAVVVSTHGMLDPWIVARRRRTKAVHAALLERPLLRCGHVHVLCEAERKVAVAYEPAMAPRTFVIPNGIEPVPALATARRSGVLYLGRLHPKKQTLELVRHWKASPELAGTELAVAGWGEPDYEAAVRAEIAAASNVRWAGRLHGAEKAAALAAARFFVLPSLSEGMPVAVLEALQAGCIPIITDGCNLPELFAEKIGIGIADDFSDFDARVTFAMGMPVRAVEEMAARGQEFARRYSINAVARAMLDRYEVILAGRTAAHG